jgi:nitrate reductase gamma subunit
MPIHLRWELYPVPGEGPKLASHGGSYFEETDWWKHPRKKDLLNELRFMVFEILLLRALWEFNRPLWWRSFPFHAGLYLLIIACLVSAAGAIGAQLSFAPTLFLVAKACAGIGLVLTLVGSIGLLLRRLTNKELRNYTVPADLLNVGGFALASGLILAGALGGGMPPLRDTVYGLLTLSMGQELPFLAALGIVLGAAMVGYIPYTHMAHFIAKYFTYHLVRWDDAQKTKAMEARITQCLSYRPTWSAAHIDGQGKKSWGEIATTNPASIERMPK